MHKRHKRIESGYFARSLAVYGREGEPCPRCGNLLRRALHQGRSSHYCPRCQRPAPRPRRDAR
ncbi:zinc finger domain-containing protein [Brachybacterium alimentarium]|uniref:zinc finger domain-containing protein n=1 Tax=Brachybacterium alimentarium TaxID=47845 RepID=UPI003B96862C